MESCPPCFKVSPSVPLWKKSDLVFIRPSKMPVSKNSLPRQGLAQFSLCLHPASLMSVPSCIPAGAALLYPGSCLEPALGVCMAADHMAPRSTWLLRRENGWAHVWVHVTNQETGSFVKLGLYYLELGKDQASFQTNQSISQFFAGLHWVLPLTNLFPWSLGSCISYPIQSFSQAR